MQLSKIKGRFKVLDLPIQYIENGEPKEEVLHIKYRPLTKQWFDTIEETEKKLEQIKKETIERLTALGELLKKQTELKESLDSAKDDERVQAQSAYDEQTTIVEQERALLETFMEESKEASSNILAKQLQPILIDLDIVDDGKPVEPSVENLAQFDFEFLLDILEGIKKKTYRR